MKITTELAGERQLSLTITIEEDQVERARRRTARQISSEVNIPGFRRGKAPYQVVVQRLGERVFRQELVSSLAEDAYRRALEEEEIVPYAPGSLEETSFDPLTLTFIVPLMPEVELGDYRDQRLDTPDVQIREDAVDQALQAIREQNAVLAPVDRPAAIGDLLVGALVGRTEEGKEFLREEEARVLLDPEGDGLLPGLVEALIGLEDGAESAFTLKLPEDFRIEALAGQEVLFDAHVAHVYERILPDLDDDLARTVGNHDSFQELEASVRQRLEDSGRAQAEGKYAEQVLQATVERAVVSYPHVALDEALDEAVDDYRRHIERQEHMMLEDYLRIEGKTEEELREELRPEVEASLVRSLVLAEVVEREGLEVSEEALDAQIAESSERYGERATAVRAALDIPEQRRGLRSRMLANKAVERLVAIAKGEAVERHAVADELGPEEAEEKNEA